MAVDTPLPPNISSFFLHLQASTHSLQASPAFPPLSPTLNWLQKMAAVSHLGMEIKGKLQRRLC